MGGGGEAQLVNFTKNPNLQKVEGGGGGKLEYVIFLKESKSKKKCGWG